MKAMVCRGYGSPDVLQLKEVEKPVPGDGEVLIRIHAAAVNSWDWELMRGRPFVNRLMFGLRKPRVILGCDVAGVVEATGPNVKRFQVGDALFGDLSSAGWGGFAEYVSSDERALSLIPKGMSYAQAAAMPQAGLLAWQGLQYKGGLQPGHILLINGAGGGVGSFAIQIAQSIGAKVTAVDRTDKLEFLRRMGADQIIDYTREDFTRNGHHYDCILDVQAHHALGDYRRALSPGGVYVMVGGSMGLVYKLMLLGRCLALTSDKKMGLLLHQANLGMAALVSLYEAGKLTSVIDRTYPLAEVPDALRYCESGSVKGKVVISMAL